MAERTVKVNLKADVSDYTAGLARAAAETRALGDNAEKNIAPGMRRAGAGAAASFGDGLDDGLKRQTPRLQSSGERSGGTLARGMQLGLVRNSPLIAAGVAGALSAGAPAVLAGATALFAGVGAVAAAQTAPVRKAWTDLGHSIRDGAIADSQVIAPVFVRMADEIGGTFERLRPQIRAAFAAAGPEIEGLLGSVQTAAEAIVPALTRAVQSAGPAIQGLGHLIEQLGQGLADFLDAISAHSGAAGEAFAAIGDIVAELLPILGQLLGQGAELASVVLPPLAKALGFVADVLTAIGPVLPGVVAGFAAMKGISAAIKPVGDFADKLRDVGAILLGISQGDGSAVKAASALESFKGAIGPIGIGVGVAVAQFALWNQQLQEWGQALAQGGAAADRASEQIRKVSEFGQVLDTGVQGAAGHMLGYGFALDSASHAAEGAAQAQRDYEASLSPVELAQLKADQAQRALNEAINKYGQGSPQAVSAANDYRAAQSDVAYQEGLTEQAISGVTQAMIDQANQALAATNSSFAYRDAQNQVEDASKTLADAQAHLGDANENTRTSTEDVERAGLKLEEALYQQAVAAGQLASDALPATASELDHNTASAQGTLAELYRLRDQMGSAFPASLQQTIKNLESTGVRLDTTSGQAQNLTNTVNGVPTFIGIHVDADLGPAEAKLNAFIQRHWTAIISSNVEGSGTTGGGGTTKRLASGGFVSGPGTSTSDSIPALLSDGEFVVNAGATRQNRALLESINARRFANGGAVSKDWTTVVYDADMSGADAGMLAARKAAGAAIMSAAAGSGGGAARWSNVVLQALALEGQSSSLLATTLRRMNQESGGNPRAINLWDSNAKRGTPSKGLMQVIDPTFRAYHDPRTSWDIYDPLANVAASMRYALARYGSLSAAYNRAGGYELGTPFVPTTDTYQLHKGEAVLNAREAESYRAGIRSRESGWSGSGGGGDSNPSAPRTVIYDQRQVHAEVDARRLSRQMANDQRDLEFLHG